MNRTELKYHNLRASESPLVILAGMLKGRIFLESATARHYQIKEIAIAGQAVISGNYVEIVSRGGYVSEDKTNERPRVEIREPMSKPLLESSGDELDDPYIYWEIREERISEFLINSGLRKAAIVAEKSGF